MVAAAALLFAANIECCWEQQRRVLGAGQEGEGLLWAGREGHKAAPSAGSPGAGKEQSSNQSFSFLFFVYLLIQSFLGSAIPAEEESRTGCESRSLQEAPS